MSPKRKVLFLGTSLVADVPVSRGRVAHWALSMGTYRLGNDRKIFLKVGNTSPPGEALIQCREIWEYGVVVVALGAIGR